MDKLSPELLLILKIIPFFLVALVIFLFLYFHGRRIVDNKSFSSIFVIPKKWTVTVSKAGKEDFIVDKFYIYPTELIYGYSDKKFTSYDVGTTETCRIQLWGAGVSDCHGKISFSPDFGLIYRNFLSESSSGYYACLEAPFNNGGTAITDFVEIYSGLKIYIGEDNVLLFTNDSSYIPEEENSSKSFGFYDDLSVIIYKFFKNLDKILKFEKKPVFLQLKKKVGEVMKKEESENV